MKKFTKIYDLTEIETVAKLLLENLEPMSVLALSGELGAGKTTLAQSIGNQLGVVEQMVSPTYIIHRTYQTTDPLIKFIHHLDFYRLQDSEDTLEGLGIPELLADPSALTIIEWPENINDELAQDKIIWVKLERISDDERKITVSDSFH